MYVKKECLLYNYLYKNSENHLRPQQKDHLVKAFCGNKRFLFLNPYAVPCAVSVQWMVCFSAEVAVGL
jgi:hypothetical protein